MKKLRAAREKLNHLNSKKGGRRTRRR
jgi:hypothetical protein